MSGMYWNYTNELIEYSPQVALIASVFSRAASDYQGNDILQSTDALIWLLLAGKNWLELTGLQIDTDSFLDRMIFNVS
jgi:hypothetical protein